MAQPPRRTPSQTLSKPGLVRRSLPGIVLVERSKVQLLDEEMLPPWQQPVQIHLGSDRSSGMQVTDLWTLKMRKNIVKAFYPAKNTSKVGSVFHSHQRKTESDKLRKRWGAFLDPVELPLGSQTSKPAKLPPLSVSASSLHVKPRATLSQRRTQG